MTSFLAMLCFGLSQFLMFQVMTADDPTKGFVSLPFNTSVYRVQKPYDKQENQRYSFKNGVHKLWVFANDKPHTTTSHTKPRTEIAVEGYGYSSGVWEFAGDAYVPKGTTGVSIMQVFGASPPHASTLMLRVYNGALMYYHNYTGTTINLIRQLAQRSLGLKSLYRSYVFEFDLQGYNYSSGVWQFQGDAYVPKGTSGVGIMQVFGASSPFATTLMLRVYNGLLMHYNYSVMVPNIYDRWFRLKVMHDVDPNKLKVYIDGELKLKVKGRGGTYHFFKCGVYAQDHDSTRMESRWKNIEISTQCT